MAEFPSPNELIKALCLYRAEMYGQSLHSASHMLCLIPLATLYMNVYVQVASLAQLAHSMARPGPHA